MMKRVVKGKESLFYSLLRLLNFSLFLFFVLAFLFINLAPVSAFSIDKTEYSLGESIIITLNNDELEKEMRIITPTTTLRHLGSLDPELTYEPKELGSFVIKLEDEELRFTVVEGITEETSEETSEETTVSITPPLTEQEVGLGSLIENNVSGSDLENESLEPEVFIPAPEDLRVYREVNIKDKVGNAIKVKAELLNERALTADVELKPGKAGVKKIKLRDVVKAQVASIDFDEVELKRYDLKRAFEEKTVKNAFFIDTSGTAFTDGEITLTAKGDELWKCKLWTAAAEQCDGNWVKVQNLVPGEEYDIAIFPGDPAFIETGVATINTEKPVYLPGESALILAAVIDTAGYLVSYANVTIQVSSPSGSTSTYTTDSGAVAELAEGTYGVTHPATSEQGEYTMFVRATAPGVDYSMLSTFMVNATIPYDIVRSTPLVFDPWGGPFLSEVNITPLLYSSTYSFTESIPSDYTIIDSFGGSIQYAGDRILITWDNLFGNETVQLIVQAPLETPDLDIFGPATVDKGNASFVEARPWYIAVDPVSEWFTQGGTYQFSAGTSTDTIELDYPVTDLSKAFIISAYSGDSGARQPQNHQITAAFFNTSHITVTRDGTADTPTISWYVVENTGGDIFVQHGSLASTSGGLTATGTLSTAVDTSKSLVVGSTRCAGTTNNDMFEGWAMLNLSDSTTVLATRAATGSVMTGEYSVIEVRNPNMNVQNGLTTINSGAGSATIPEAVDLDRAWLYLTWDSDDNSLDTSTIGGVITGTTSITFDRDATGAGFVNRVRWNILEFPDGTSINRQTLSYAASVFLDDIPVSPAADLNKTFAYHTNICDGTGTAFPRAYFNNFYTSSSNLRLERYYNGQPVVIYLQQITLPDPNLIPEVSLDFPDNDTLISDASVDFLITVTDDNNFIKNCTLYTNETGLWEPRKSVLTVQNDTQTNITWNLADGSYTWNVRCEDYYGSFGWAPANYTFELIGISTVQVNDIEGNTSNPFTFESQSPTLNLTILDRAGDCYLSAVDESYSQMVTNGRDNCGSFSLGVPKTCTYSGTLPIDLSTLHVSCNTTSGVESNTSNNRDIPVDVRCDTHADCPASEHCDAGRNCALDIITGFNCFDIGFEGGGVDEVCGNGTDSFCVNDSSYSFTGWYCTGDEDDCVYANDGNTYDFGEVLCISASNDYHQCGPSNTWNATVDCGDSTDPANQSATTQPGEYCNYYLFPQTCVNGSSGGCVGDSVSCAGYIYNQTTFSCGSLLKDCDVGCGADCDTSNSTTPEIISDICYYDRACDNTCSWSVTTEDAPLFCINDNDAGPCAFDNRTDPTTTDSCYWSPVCVDVLGASLTSGVANNLRANYCDYCNGSGNQNGDFSPAPNASCAATCADTGIIYYDSGGTFGDRSDDCNTGSTTILNDTLTFGDIWNGTGPATCDNAECNADCGTLVGACNVGVCECTDFDLPIITLLTPLPGFWSDSTSVTFQYNVSDISSGIENCSLLINGSVTETNSSLDLGAESQSFTTTLSQGPYTWAIRCYDNGSLNNMNETSTRFVGVDLVDPSVSNPARNQTTMKINAPVCLQADASDVLSGIGRVYALVVTPSGTSEIDLYDDAATSCDPVIGDGTYSVNYEVPLSGDYNYTYAFAVDNAGNSVNTSAGFFFNVTEGGFLTANLTDPLTDLEINESGANNNFTMNCEATCEEGFIDCTGVELQVEYNNGSDWYRVTNTTEDLVLDVASYECGLLSAIQAPWWNNSFQYRRQMRVKTTSAITADHVIRVDFDTTGSNFRDDAEDLRIVFWNGSTNTEVDRQVFRPNETDSTIWFVIGDALAANSSNYFYYIYFGNESAVGAKNDEENIWLFYDDFSDGTYTDKWGNSGGTIGGVVSVSNPWTGNNNVLSVGACAAGNSYVKVLTSELSPIRDMASRILWLDNPGTTCGTGPGGSPDADGVVGLQANNDASYNGILVERDTDTGFHYDAGATGSVGGSQYYSPFDEWQWSEQYGYGTSPSNYKARYWGIDEAEPLNYPLVATGFSTGYPQAGQPFIRTYSGIAYVAVVMIRPTVEVEPFTQIKDADDISVPTVTSCNYTFTVTSGPDSGDNTYPMRCVATSTNSQIDESDETFNATINDKPFPVLDYPGNNSWLANVENLNASSSFDSDGTVTNYLFEYDNSTAFSSPATICSGSIANCSWDTRTQSQCVNNSLSCYLRLTVTDNDGLQNSTFLTIGFDTAGPVTTLLSPVPFENISSNIFTVNATATDAIVSVSTVTFEYRENASAPWIGVCNTTVSPYSCSWNLASLSDGTAYEVRAYANDTNGKVGAADTHTNITLDRNGPLIQLISPQSGIFTANTTLFFQYNVTDETSDVSSCSLFIDNTLAAFNDSITEGSTLLFSDTQGPGFHEWNISCTDEFGNTNVSELRNFTIDLTGPVSTLIDPPNFATITGVDTYQVNATVIDAGVGNISVVTFEYRESATGSWIPACVDADGLAPFSCSWDLIGLVDGSEYQVRVYANDTLGNIGSPVSNVLITIDRNPPMVSLLFPPDGSADGDGNLLFQYEVMDTGGTVSNCSFIWEGSVNQTEPGPITEGQTYSFTLLNVSDGNYTWTVNCTDQYGQEGTGGVRDLEVDIRFVMNITVTTNASEYQRGDQISEDANITTNVTDLFGAPLNVTLVTDIVDVNTSYRWFDAAWDHRQEVIVTNNLPSQRTILVDIQVDTLSLVIDGKLQSTCDDIRFTDLDGEVLDFYQNSACNTGSTSFLISLTLPASGNTSILMYYDNPSASSNSTVAAPRSIIGETGAVSTSNFQFVDVQFSNTYGTTPLVLATPATQNGAAGEDDSALIPTISNINTTGMTISICQDNGAATCDLTVTSETLHYFVIDVEKANSFSWMAAGTQSVTTDGEDTVISYGKTFSNIPILWLTPQTYSQGGNISAIAWAEDITVRGSTSGPVVGCVHQAPGSGTSVDNCESGQPDETLGFLAIDISAVDIDTFQTSSASISGSSWTGATFVPSYLTPRVMVTQNDDNGGNDPQYAWARLVTGSGMQYRYCESDNADVCDGHTGETVNWFALEQGNITAPGAPDSNFSVSFGDEIEHVLQYNGSSGIEGIFSYIWDFAGRDSSVFTALSVGSKSKYEDGFNYTAFTLRDDYIGPNVTLNSPPNGSEANSTVTFTYFVEDQLSTVANCTLYIDGVVDAIDTQIEEGPTQFFFPRIPSGGPHQWWVLCYDAFGNPGLSQNWTVIIIPPDLSSNVSNITITPSPPYIEGQLVTINASIFNIGGSDTGINFTTQLWDGYPGKGGTQIGDNFSINLTDKFGVNSNASLLWNWTIARPGPSTLYLLIDVPLETNGSIFEIFEYNNNISFNITTSGYVDVVGNVTGYFVLDTAQNDSFIRFNTTGNNTGLIFFADAESSVSFTSLQALGLDISNSTSSNDFTDADTLLNMTHFNDSVNSVWAQGNNTPQKVESFTVSDRLINDVPVIDSSVSGAFKTGILWDTADDGVNTEYDTSDEEDIVFITRINKSASGDYGVTDFQSKVPALLRNYKGSGGSTIYLYYELT
jgi:hypothetical protein